MSQNETSCDFCGEPHEEVINMLTKKVDDVYRFQDRYFENHNIEDAIRKKGDVEALVLETLADFEKTETRALKCNKAKFYYLKGRLLNVLPKYNKECEELLSKALKLDRKLVDAWNELGICYWKNGEYKKSVNCYETALKESKNKISLRNLSILTRQELSKKRDEKISNIEKGLNYAKDAVELDPQDGLSWSILGNAYLSKFFGVQQNPKTLKLCLSAYMQAEKDIVGKSSPDLHYNKGIILKYDEEYKLALESFKMASLYDPTWDLPTIKQKQLLQYLNDIQEYVSTNGKMKSKRLKQMLQSIDSKHLGPYKGGKYTSTNGQTAVLEECSISRLKTGINQEKVILGKVVCSVRNEDILPFTFCMVDKDGTCVVVTVFNIAEGRGVIIGDSVAIPEPFVTEIDFAYETYKYNFRLIRVETPVVMVVNEKKLARDQQADVQMSSIQEFD